jgi:hypothetical protein
MSDWRVIPAGCEVCRKEASRERIIVLEELQARFIALEELQAQSIVWEGFWAWQRFGRSFRQSSIIVFFEV